MSIPRAYGATALKADLRWSLVTPDALAIRCWPDGGILFNARESNTMMLSPDAAALAAVLLKAPASTDELMRAVGDQLDDPEALSDLLQAMSDHGIVHKPG